jgi:hypothetical protein
MLLTFARGKDSLIPRGQAQIASIRALADPVAPPVACEGNTTPMFNLRVLDEDRCLYWLQFCWFYQLLAKTGHFWGRISCIRDNLQSVDKYSNLYKVVYIRPDVYSRSISFHAQLMVKS